MAKKQDFDRLHYTGSLKEQLEYAKAKKSPMELIDLMGGESYAIHHEKIDLHELPETSRVQLCEFASKLNPMTSAQLRERGIRILTLDPGHTTGYSFLFQPPERVSEQTPGIFFAGQLKTPTLFSSSTQAHIKALIYLLTSPTYVRHQAYCDAPLFVRIEDYRVYSWKTQSHEWSSLHTAKLIGYLTAILTNLPIIKIPLHYISLHSAQSAKGFAKDEKLKEFNIYLPSKPHARDALRHLMVHLFFDIPKILAHHEREKREFYNAD